MIRSHYHHLTKATVKETAFDRLPRPPRDPLVELGRQGFDDGYFGNAHQVPDEMKHRRAYDTAFLEGKAQRERIDRRNEKRRVAR